MNKKILIGVIALGLSIFLIAFFIKYQKSVKYKKAISNFPEIALIDFALDSNVFYDKGVINCFLIFNSECMFCLDEIEDTVDNIEDFKNVNFYLVSNETEDILNEYSEDSEFLGIENFTIIIDKDEFFYNFFKHPVTPSIYLYTKKGGLINYSQGFLPVYELKSMISEN